MSQNHNLLSIPLKSSPPLSTLTPALRNHISTSYTDTHPSAFSSDIRELQRLRDEWSSTTDVHVSATDLGIRYHAQLVWLGGKMASDVSTLTFALLEWNTRKRFWIISHLIIFSLIWQSTDWYILSVDHLLPIFSANSGLPWSFDLSISSIFPFELKILFSKSRFK